MRISFTAYLRKFASKDRYGTLYVRVSVERKHIYLHTGETLETKHWNAPKKRVRGSCSLADSLNDLLALKIHDAHQVVLNHKLAGGAVNYVAVYQLFNDAPALKAEHTTLKTLADKYAVHNDLKQGTTKQYGTTISLTEKENWPKNIALIKEEHVTRLRKNLTDSGAMKNTGIGHLKRLRALFTFALERKLIKTDPMQFVKIGSWESKPEFLTQADIDKIEAILPGLPPGAGKVARAFLFCCYAGLRFGDVCGLEPEMIKETENGPALQYSQDKGGKAELLPLLPQALALLPHIYGYKISNQKYNDHLKRVMVAAGITTNVTSHLARHTFATIGLNRGIPITTMQALLGHSDIKTTLLYAKLINTTKANDLTLWNK